MNISKPCNPVYGLLIVLALGLTACNGSSPVKPTDEEKEAFLKTLVYPPAPDEPRYHFEMSLLSSAQVVPRDEESKWRSLLTGETGPSGEGLAKPFDVAACSGRVYVTDTVQRHVAVFDFKNRTFFTIGTDDPGLLQKPLGINTDANCNVYVADATKKRIMIYSSEGQYLRELGSADSFSRLSHVAASADGSKVFAVDTGGVQSEQHVVRVFNAITGEHLYDIGKRGREEGELNLPRDVEIGPDGNVYVIDGGNFRVQVFSPEGQFIRTFGSVGSRSGQFSRPKGIAVDKQGLIYVSDAAFGNFQIFNPQGQLLMSIGQRSNTRGPAKYILPAGIDTDEDGRIFFVGQFYHKVDIFRPHALSADHGAIGQLIQSSKTN